MKSSLPEDPVLPTLSAPAMVNNTVETSTRFPLASVKIWAGVLTRFLSLEVLIQSVGFLAGVLLVRVLPKAEYAWFTIANTMQQTMNLLADNGISSGLTAIGGRVWSDRSRFGQLINTAMRLRRVLALLAIVVVTPILAWMLLDAGATPAQSALLCAAVLAGLYFQLSIGVLIVAPLLHLEANRVQNLNLGSALLRLALILAAYLLVLNAFVALVAAAISFAFQEMLLRRWLSRYADTEAPPNAGDREEIVSIIKSQAPNAIYYCLQSQLMIWLISIFGDASGVADVGALGRIGMIFLALGSVLTNVVMPRFARVQEPRLLWRRYWQIIGVLCGVSALLLVFVRVFPEAFLWILGPKYARLKDELFLMIVGTILSSVLGTMYHLNLTKGWIVSPWLLIPIGMATEIFLIVILDLSQVRGVLLMAVLSTIPGFFLNAWRAWKGVRDATHS